MKPRNICTTSTMQERRGKHPLGASVIISLLLENAPHLGMKVALRNDARHCVSTREVPLQTPRPSAARICPLQTNSPPPHLLTADQLVPSATRTYPPQTHSPLPPCAPAHCKTHSPPPPRAIAHYRPTRLLRRTHLPTADPLAPSAAHTLPLQTHPP